MPGAGDTLAGIYRADREKLLSRRRFSFGSVVAFAGGQAEIDVGATLPDGNTVYLSRPAAEGFTPAEGQQIAIVYPNNSPHSGYAAAPGTAAAVAPGGTVIPDGSVTAAKIADGACLAEILDDDGAGSLLDADKLDGNEATAFAVAAKGVTNGDSHDHAGGDGAAIPVGGLAAALAALIQGTPTITVGSESGNKINVAVQLKDAAGTSLAAAHVCQVWLSDSAGGAVTATAPDGAVAIGTNGIIIASHTAKTHLVVASNATGQFDIDITESGTPTFYMNLEYQGKLFTSAAITFA